MSIIRVKTRALLRGIARIDRLLKSTPDSLLQIKLVNAERMELIGLHRDKRPIISSVFIEPGSCFELSKIYTLYLKDLTRIIECDSLHISTLSIDIKTKLDNKTIEIEDEDGNIRGVILYI